VATKFSTVALDIGGPQARIYAGASGARAQGGILKKSGLKYGMRKKKGCPRERNLREIYTENNVVSGIAGIVELINCTWKLN